MFTIKLCPGVSEYKIIRSGALLSDPDAFGELHEKFISKSDHDIELYLIAILSGEMDSQ